MGVAVAPAWPDEAVGRLQDLEIVAGFDPGIALLAEHTARLAAGCVYEIKIKLVLGTVEHRGPDHAIAHPAKARNVDVFFIGQVKPLDGAAACADYAELDFRIGIAHFRIF